MLKMDEVCVFVQTKITKMIFIIQNENVLCGRVNSILFLLVNGIIIASMHTKKKKSKTQIKHIVLYTHETNFQHP